MSGFVFNGKSRTSGLKLARDHCLSRTDVLATAQKTRRAMDEENRRTTAATTIQCAVRRHRAQQDVLARAYHALYALHNLASPTSEDAGSGASSTALVQRWQHAAWCYSAVMRRRHLLSQAFCSALLGPTSGVEKGQTEVLQRCRRPITELMASLSTSSDGHDMCGLLDGVSHNTIVALIETLLHDFLEWTLHPTLVHRTTSPLEVLAMTIHAITHQPRPALVESLACLVMDGCRRELHNSPQARRQLVPILSGLMDSIAVLPSPQMCAALNVGCATPLLVDACWESLAAPPTSLLGLCSSPVSVLLSVSTTQEDCVDDASLEERARQAAILVHSCYTKLESCTSSTFIHVPSYRHALHALCRLLPFFRELLESQLSGQEEESSNSTIILANPLHRGWMQCIDGLLSVLYSSPHFLKQLMQDIQSLRTATNTDCPHGITCFLQDQGIRFFAMALRAEEEEARRGSPSSTSSSSSPPTTTLSSPMEALMGVYAWPIYGLTLMSSSSADFRSSCEWACCRIASAPNMLAALWRCFRQRSPNLRRLLSSEGEWAELLEQCTRPSRAVHPPRWENAAPQTMFGEGLGLRSCIRVDAPALSVLFLRMVAYFLEARNSVGGFDLQLIMNDVELRVFALVMKELVYRACTFGVAPKSKTAAVIHVACDVLAQLYALRQSPSFAGYPSLWIAVEEGKEALLPLVGLSLGAWEDEVDRILRESSRVVEVSDNNNNNNAAEECISRDAVLSWAEFSPRFEGSSGWNARERLLRLLVHAPFTVAFAVRGKLLMSLPPPDYDDGSSFMQRETRVSRGTTFADAYVHFQRHPLRSSMAKIRFVDVWGHVEEGYGYGVYREFVLAVCADGLSAEHGLFAQTADGLLFPNPYSLETTGDEDHLGKIEFLGAIVGRAVYDGILQEARFARHFLQTLVGRRSHVRELHHLDPELYHNLQSLKEMSEEELEGLDIRFTVTVMNPLGVGQEVELLPNGAEQRVSRATYEQYIQLVGEYKLNREGHTQTMAFARGLGKVISPTLLRLLNCDELQQLFSGDGRINVDDWERHTTIDQCPDEDRIYIDQFWAVVRSLTTEQQSLLLQFATSLKRPPLLGFRYLSPPFKLQLLDPREDRDRLPSSSTCFSLLKLPRYSSIATAREKIIAAIEGAHSFEHS